MPPGSAPAWRAPTQPQPGLLAELPEEAMGGRRRRGAQLQSEMGSQSQREPGARCAEGAAAVTAAGALGVGTQGRKIWGHRGDDSAPCLTCCL